MLTQNPASAFDLTESLSSAPILFLFVETSAVSRQHALFEEILSLPVIENQFHPPHHRHGLFKYDAGSLIVGLNLSADRRFLPDESDAAVVIYRVPWTEKEMQERLLAGGFALTGDGTSFTDPWGHHYQFHYDLSCGSASVAEELQLVTADLTQSFDFYARKLGLKLLDRGERWLRFTTGTVALRIELRQTAMDGRRLRRDTYLPVFQTLDIHRSFEVLRARGTTFKADRPGFSQIGGTARFADPDGQTFCLYEPSAESLTWGSGAKVRAIAGIPM